MPFDWGLIDALVGYLVSAVVGELTIKRPRGNVPAASLEPRKLSDYLPAPLLWGSRATAAAALLLVATFQILNAQATHPYAGPHPVVIGTTILAVALSVELLQRLIVARPQPAADRDVTRADDAIRSASVHALAGARSRSPADHLCCSPHEHRSHQRVAVRDVCARVGGSCLLRPGVRLVGLRDPTASPAGVAPSERTGMILRIEPDSHVPPYEQIRFQIATMAASGVLREGTRLPSIRQLAADLQLAGGTVARAFRELEQQRVVQTRGRHGTFVQKVPSAPTTGPELDAAAASFVARARQLGIGVDQAVESVRLAYTQSAFG